MWDRFTTEFKWFLGIALLGLFVAQDWYVFEQGKKVQMAETAIAQSNQKDAVIGKVLENGKQNEVVRVKQDEINRKVSNETETKIAAARDFKPAAKRLRITVPASAISNHPAATSEANSASESDASATATVVLPEEIGISLRLDIAKRADEVTESCRGLQKWVIDQGFFTPPEPDKEAIVDEPTD